MLDFNIWQGTTILLRVSISFLKKIDVFLTRFTKNNRCYSTHSTRTNEDPDTDSPGLKKEWHDGLKNLDDAVLQLERRPLEKTMEDS